MVKFTIDGQPVAKGRPRHSRWGTYTPQKTKDYEKHVQECYKNQVNVFLENDLEMKLDIYMQIPKSTTKRLHLKMLNNELRPSKKPDIDNIIKSVADGLNQVAYKDDSQIIKIVAEKFYSDNPRIEVTIVEHRKE